MHALNRRRQNIMTKNKYNNILHLIKGTTCLSVRRTLPATIGKMCFLFLIHKQEILQILFKKKHEIKHSTFKCAERCVYGVWLWILNEIDWLTNMRINGFVEFIQLAIQHDFI